MSFSPLETKIVPEINWGVQLISLRMRWADNLSSEAPVEKKKAVQGQNSFQFTFLI